jgi:hypothetical protein
MGDIEALAATFAANAERPGEPVTPPLLVVDGDGWRIVDGERRVRAMEALGTEEFTALVADDMDEANAALAMLATDAKQPLTSSERAHGFQQALLLGVPPDMAAKAARVAAEDAYRVRWMVMSGPRMDVQATLDQLLAAARLADEGDDEAAELVAGAGPAEWEAAYGRICCRREHDKAFQELTAVLGAVGLAHEELADHRPWEHMPPGEGWSYQSAHNADALKWILGDVGTDGTVCKAYPGGDGRWQTPRVFVYYNSPPADDDGDGDGGEVSEERALRLRHEDAWERDHDRRKAFLAGWADGFAIDDLGRWLAYACIGSRHQPLAPGAVRWFLDRDDDELTLRAAAQYTSLLTVLAANGYVLSPEEIELDGKCMEIAAGAGDGDE